MNKSEIILIEERVQHYPDIRPEHYKCKMLGKDNNHYRADLHETEVEICKFLWSVKHKLKQEEISNLKDLIDNYGQRKYEEGGNQNQS